MEASVLAWLRGLGLERYEQTFRDNAIDAETLPELTDIDLEKLGILLGHRKRMLRAIAARETAPSVPVPTSSMAVATLRPRANTAERRHLTVMFCDMVDSTALAARLDPEDLREVIGAYHRAITEAMVPYEGFVAKYLGDGVLVYFGYPRAHEDDAERAIRAALSLLTVAHRIDRSDYHLQVRIGIATGLAVVGDLLGVGAAQEEAVIGEVPALAARLQTLAAPNTIVMDDRTRRLVGALFEMVDLGVQALKGFGETQRAWRVVGESRVESRFEALRSGETPLVGRAEELDLMLRRWARAKAGEGNILLLSGEPGIGKSRLTAALQEQLHLEPNIRLRYFCSPHHRDSMLYPFIAQLERAAGFTREDTYNAKLDKLQALLSRSGSNSAETMALFADLLELPTDGRYPDIECDPQHKRELILGALLGQLDGLAQQRPVLLIIEDAHWIDSTSLELMERVVERMPRLPVLVVITFRPEFEPPWVGRAHVTMLSLSRLGEQQAAALVNGVARDKALPREIIDGIIKRTDGIPLFIEELTKTLLEGGLLREEHDRYDLDGPLPPLAIPPSLHASLIARLDRLAPVKEVAQIGAALGREFSYELLAAVAGRSDDELQNALDQLSSTGLVFRRGIPPQMSFIFKHALVQDAAYSTLLRSQRQELHARIGKALEQRYPETGDLQPEILAHHYTEAGLIDPAAEYWRKAGERALRRSANVEAITHLNRGIELTRLLPMTPERDRRELRLYLALGPAMRAIKGHCAPEVLEVYSHARNLLDENATAKEQMSVRYGLWIIHFVRSEHAAALNLAQECVEASTAYPNTDFPALSHSLMGNALWATGVFVEARPHLERTLRLCEPGPENIISARASETQAVAALSFLGFTLWPLGYPQQAAAAAEQAVARARSTGHVPSTALALHNQAFLMASYGAGQQLIGTDPSVAEDYCVEHGVAAYEHWARFCRGAVLAQSGDPAHGMHVMREAMDAAEKISARMFRSVQLGHMAIAHAGLGEPDIGLELLLDAARTTDETGERFFEAELYRLQGDMLMDLGNVSAAEAALQRALTIARVQHARLWELRAATSLAHLWHSQGRGSEARDLLATIYGWFTEGFDTPDLKGSRALLDELAAGGVSA